MKTAARYQLRAQGRSFVPRPNKFGGITGRSPGERPHYEIAGESPGKRDLMWTQGQILECICIKYTSQTSRKIEWQKTLYRSLAAWRNLDIIVLKFILKEFGQWGKNVLFGSNFKAIKQRKQNF